MKRIVFILLSVFLASVFSQAQSLKGNIPTDEWHRNPVTGYIKGDSAVGVSTINRMPVSLDSNITLNVITANSTTFTVKNLTTDSVQLDSNVCKYLNISLKLSCTDTLFIANDSTVSAETGIELLGGDAIRLPCTNTNQFWIRGSGASVNTVKLWWEN
jgi:hypothetical protein